jgi:predicted NAD/FAD-binding protein
MRVAVVGAGISGLGAAIALHGRPNIEVVLFEKESRLGGHAHTIDVGCNESRLAADTGFIVYNELNYPNLTALFDWAGVETIESDMSFALSSDDGAFEWCGRHVSPLRGLFAQKRNGLDFSFYRFLLGIRRFQRRAIVDHQNDSIGGESLEQYLVRIGCHDRVRDDYIVPMGAAIWSMTPGATLAFPARSFIAFFNNHKLLQWDRPRWRTVRGGSREYVRKLAERLGPAVRTTCGIAAVDRQGQAITIRDEMFREHRFDAVIFATHAPTALSLLGGADDDTRAILGAFRVSQNRVVVHRDPTLMPQRRQAWASWNVLRRTDSERAAVTYWMNRLQSLSTTYPLFVTLNPDRPIQEDLIVGSFDYDHPVYDSAAIEAQQKLISIQGRGNIYFAGAWTGHGFHEDGLRSGFAAATRLGGLAPWLR